ncbi:MAG: ATP-binding protein [bacterium]
MSAGRTRRLTIVSGKGGTGKTVVSASFAVLAGDCVLADCDVDAADLHLLFQPELLERHEFSGGGIAARDLGACNDCGQCREVCRFGAVADSFEIDPVACEGCGFCARVCPTGAIKMQASINGEWYVSRVRCGMMVHARLGPAEENSGKLVTAVRKRAAELAEERNARYVIADGPPGIGCPVIASITGADMVLGVAEPSLCGIHDLKRVVEVAARFRIPVGCLVNRFDINPDNARELEVWCRDHGVAVVGRVPYDEMVMKAVVAGRAVVEAGPCAARSAIEAAWQEVRKCLAN